MLRHTGMRWGEVVDRWVRQQELFPTRRYARATLIDYEAMLQNWTKPWLDRVASELNRADGREVIRAAELEGMSTSFKQRLKNTIHRVYPKAQLPMWHLYRVELWPNFGQPFGIRDIAGNSLNFAQAFRISRTNNQPKGIIELVRCPL